MKKVKHVDSLLVRLKEAEKKKDWAIVLRLLDDTTQDNASMLVPIIPDLLKCPNWIVRATAVERVGMFGMRKYVDLVTERLDDKVIYVRAYALMAYYDLLGKESLSVIEQFFLAKHIGLRVTALALHYVETHQEDVWKALTRIMLRRNCNYTHGHRVLHVFDYYLDVSSHPEIIDLFKNMLKNIPKSLGLYKDIKQRLSEWTQPPKKKGGHRGQTSK